MNRIRTRTALAQRRFQWFDRLDSTGVTTVTADQTSFRSDVIARISDTIGSRWQDHPTDHVRYRLSALPIVHPFSARVPSNGRSAAMVDSDFFVGGCPGQPTFDVGVDWDSLANQLLQDALGTMPLSANLVVNALEAASVKKMIPEACKIARKIISEGFAKKSLKEMANGHLLYSFGVKPLITDIKGILSVRQAVKKRIQQLNARNGVTTRISKRAAVEVATSVDYARGDAATGQRVTTVTKWEGDALATLSADVQSFFVDNSESQAKLWGQALGLSTPLSSIWESRPFSFVADWLLPLGDHLARVESKLLNHETVKSHILSNMIWSIKIVAGGNTQAVCKSTIFPKWNSKVYAMGHEYTRYTRDFGIPATSLIPPVGWSVGRTALSISLTLQKVLK